MHRSSAGYLGISLLSIPFTYTYIYVYIYTVMQSVISCSLTRAYIYYTRNSVATASAAAHTHTHTHTASLWLPPDIYAVAIQTVDSAKEAAACGAEKSNRHSLEPLSLGAPGANALISHSPRAAVVSRQKVKALSWLFFSKAFLPLEKERMILSVHPCVTWNFLVYIYRDHRKICAIIYFPASIWYTHADNY